MKEDMLGKGHLICEGEFFQEKTTYSPEVLSYEVLLPLFTKALDRSWLGTSTELSKN